MKKMIGIFCLICFLYFIFWNHDDRSEEEKMAHEAVYNTIATLKSRYPLHYIGLSESGDTDYYHTIGLSFQLLQIISKEDGRKMLVDCVEELLKEINSNPKLLPYLNPSPFTAASVTVAIYVYHKNGTDPSYPNIGIFSVRDGIVEYITQTPETRAKYQYYTTEKESYEEALKIVRSQTSSQTKNI